MHAAILERYCLLSIAFIECKINADRPARHRAILASRAYARNSYKYAWFYHVLEVAFLSRLYPSINNLHLARQYYFYNYSVSRERYLPFQSLLLPNCYSSFAPVENLYYGSDYPS